MLDAELINLSSDNKEAEIRLIPNIHAPLTVHQLQALLKQPDFHRLCPNDCAIAEAVSQVNGPHDQEDGDNELGFVIAERLDGTVKIELSKDKMQAEMVLTAAWGGLEICFEDIQKSLKDTKIRTGINKDAIKTQLALLPTCRPGQTFRCIVAEGKPAIDGDNARLERKVALARERLLQPRERADGTVDMRDLGAVVMVKPGDLLMEKHPATLGTVGFNVQGKVLAPKPGKDTKLNSGKGTEISPQDPNKLIATATGQPVEVKDSLQIDDVLKIKEVDVGYGHVSFKGSILISGDVHAGMIVRSSGDITVMGFVDSATLEADGDITVSKGIIGRKKENQALSTKIRARGRISAQFVQYSELDAIGDILITKQLLHSNTKTRGVLTVSDANSRRGDLIGGMAYSDKGIKSVVIGATAGTKTAVFCAMRIHELQQQQMASNQRIKALITKELELKNNLKNLPPKVEWQADQRIVDRIRTMIEDKQKLAQTREQEMQKRARIKDKINNYYPEHFITVNKGIFDNVELRIGQAFHRTKREYGPCQVVNRDKKIQFDFGDN